ncbi:MAG: HAMP domain-containing histidine kinase [Candidatus Nitronauta litoralis]|uniref:histidine kinase n=1 Tax=Candidatus Nitronauta litoralis TaxID=2705533 RepID=A0A7T0BW51_9BACT|nr:MAG: HAMP domain-containing histidine kinase [Candidatus Nitronauta litoralis]
MNLKTLIVLWTIIIVPLALLGWLGYDRSVKEREMRNFQLQALIEGQLKSVDTSLQNYFANLEEILLQAVNDLPDEPENIRKFLKKRSRIRQVLWFGPEGTRLHPPEKAPLTEKEKQFLERTLGVIPRLDQNMTLEKNKPFPKEPAPGKRSSLSPKSSAPVEDPRNDRGWFVWHSGSELVHFFWRRDPARGLIAFELEPVRLLADVIGQLPATGGEVDGSLPNARIRLIDSSGETAYQWGNHEPLASDTPITLLPLGMPLASWHLEYFAPGFAGDNSLEWFNYAAGFFALGAALLGLGFYLYREHSREVRLAQQRVNFVSQVSHELRTPLTNIRLYAELLDEKLGDEPDSDPKIQQYIGVITTECRRLSRLIANVLNFSREAEKQSATRKEPCRIDDIIRNVLTAFEPTLKAKGIKIRFRGGANNEVIADPDAVEQILNNLVSNMEKYGAAGKRLDVVSEAKNNLTTIKVRDYGPGIPKKERRRIFHPFYRISSRLTDGVAGTGIGLPIAHKLAIKHGGTLTLEAVDKGACFQVQLHTPPAERMS